MISCLPRVYPQGFVCALQDSVSLVLDLEKPEEPEIQIANIHWIIEKARQFQKNIYFSFIAMPKRLTVWISTNCGKFWKRWEY